MQQLILNHHGSVECIGEYFAKCGVKKIFLVHGKSFLKTGLWEYFRKLQTDGVVDVVTFSDFTPNPDDESVEKGKQKYMEEACDAIVAAGGGSCIDVAKCIKIAYQTPFLAIPTTSGTGSEATRYAVIYCHGEKQSITDESCIPDAVYFDAGLIATVPPYQRKATMMDALCHGIEAFWSVNSTNESRAYAKSCIKMILESMDGYLANEAYANEKMLAASNLAGKAINIAQTTGGHAMSYRLTKLYGYAHGHAVAICDVWLWHYMVSHMELCIDKRGRKYLENVFQEMAEIMGYQTVQEAVYGFQKLVESLQLSHGILESDIPALAADVNPDRLKNNPVKLCSEAVEEIYTAIDRWKM